MHKFSVAAILGFGMLGGIALTLSPAQGETFIAQSAPFAVGDIVEVNRQNQWRRSEVLAVQQVNGQIQYQVRYLDIGFSENNVPQNRLRSPQESVVPSQSIATTIFEIGEPVLVMRDGSLTEARIVGYVFSSRSGYRYNVVFADNQQGETGVHPNRIQTLAAAQAQNIATSAYDLSTQAGIEQMVAAHNAWRSPLGLPPLEWSDELAVVAQDWAEKLLVKGRMQHSQDNDYGENLATARNRQLSVETVVNLWGDEVSDYDYDTNRCAPGKVCGHYTQIVWAETTKVGCGMARENGLEMWVCNYDPPGNYVGERPY